MEKPNDEWENVVDQENLKGFRKTFFKKEEEKKDDDAEDKAEAAPSGDDKK